LLCMACGDRRWDDYICEEIKACKTSNYILTKFPVKPVQILKSDRFCGIIKTELLYTFFKCRFVVNGSAPTAYGFGYVTKCD